MMFDLPSHGTRVLLMLFTIWRRENHQASLLCHGIDDQETWCCKPPSLTSGGAAAEAPFVDLNT